MAASQNGFCSYKLSIHKKTNIMQITTKILHFYLFNLLSQRNYETSSFYDTFLELCKHRSVMQPLQNPPFCSSTVSSYFPTTAFTLFSTLSVPVFQSYLSLAFPSPSNISTHPKSQTGRLLGHKYPAQLCKYCLLNILRQMCVQIGL